MALQFVTEPAQINSILESLERAAAHWGSAGAQAWRLAGGVEGVSFARDASSFFFIERQDARVAFGVARSGDGPDALRVSLELNPAEPALEDAALVWDEDDADAFVLLGEAALERQGLREPFRRLAGTPMVRRAEVDGRSYVMVGPLAKPRAVEAMAAIAGLATDTGAPGDGLYPLSPGVVHAHRATGRALAHLEAQLTQAGYRADRAETGGLSGDMAMSQDGRTLVFVAPRTLATDALACALGGFAVFAPALAGCVRVLLLPAPHGDDGGALERFLPALQELHVSVLFFDLTEDAPRFWFAVTDDALSAHVRDIVNAPDGAL